MELPLIVEGVVVGPGTVTLVEEFELVPQVEFELLILSVAVPDQPDAQSTVAPLLVPLTTLPAVEGVSDQL